eukprot:2974387-Amphidinium_carterae.4
MRAMCGFAGTGFSLRREQAGWSCSPRAPLAWAPGRPIFRHHCRPAAHLHACTVNSFARDYLGRT